MKENLLEISHRLGRAQAALLSKQEPSGAWFAGSDMGPVCTAQVYVALKWVGALADCDGESLLRWLCSQQREDGSFLPYPHAKQGTLEATVFCYAALLAGGVESQKDHVNSAWNFILRHGGEPSFGKALFSGDLSPLYLALARDVAGVLDSKTLPSFPTTWSAAKPLLDMCHTRVHAGITLGALQVGVILSALRRDKAFDWNGSRRRVLEWISPWQNADGSINGNSVQTALSLATFHAAGLGRRDPRVVSAVQSLWAAKRSSEQGSWFLAFESDVWTTALNTRALLRCGMDPGDDRLKRAILYLLSCQAAEAQPAVNQRQKGAPRTGGWAFQKLNTSMVDCDDTGMVLGILSEYLMAWRGRYKTESIDDRELVDRICTAIQAGRKWLLGMQNPDGGWSAFVWGLGRRRSGPMMVQSPTLPSSSKDLADWGELLLHPPEEWGDPSTEDVTARVLYGLARTLWLENQGLPGLASGRGDNALLREALRRGVDFLRAHQCGHGGFWGRWVVNYLPSTVYALHAASALGISPDAFWVRHATEFLLNHQNADGGFGETEASFADPRLAGQGTSTPSLTALVVSALIDMGRGEDPAVAKGLAYLLETQKDDGTWPGLDSLAVFIPPNSFYEYPGSADYAPLEAFAKTLASSDHGHESSKRRDQQFGVSLSGIQGLVSTSGLWSGGKTKYVETMAQWDQAALRGDPLADEAALALTRGGFEFEDFVGSLPLGQGMKWYQWIRQKRGMVSRRPMPAEVGVFLEHTSRLPEGVDHRRLERGAQFFQRHHFAIGEALFFAVLPQSYASVEGAKILTKSYGLGADTHRRILSTSDYVYSVMDLSQEEKRSGVVLHTQIVRMLHAFVRLRQKGDQGNLVPSPLPISQEQLLGTTLLLSVVVLESLDRLGYRFSLEEAEDWIHLWSVAGAMMGTEKDLLPKDVVEASQQMEWIRQRMWKPSAEGQSLTAALVRATKAYSPFAGFAQGMIYHLCGHVCAEMLGVPPAPQARRWIETMALTPELFPKGAPWTRWTAGPTKAFMKTQSFAWRGANHFYFNRMAR